MEEEKHKVVVHFCITRKKFTAYFFNVPVNVMQCKTYHNINIHKILNTAAYEHWDVRKMHKKSYNLGEELWIFAS